jgi:hypothetical protein
MGAVHRYQETPPPYVKSGDALKVTLVGPISVFVSRDGTVYVKDREYLRIYENGQANVVCGVQSDRGSVSAPTVAELPDGSIFFLSHNQLRVVHNGHVTTLYDFTKSVAHMLLGVVADVATGTLIVISRYRIWKVHGVLDKQLVYTMTPAIDYEPDHSVRINDFELRYHKSFISQRCPLLLSSEALLTKPLDRTSVELFRKFLYSNSLPVELSAHQLMGLAVRFLKGLNFTISGLTPSCQYLFHAVGFDDRTSMCLRLLENSKVSKGTAVEDLMALYCLAQDLQPFKPGEKVAIRLMRANRDLLVPHTNNFSKLLGKHNHMVMDLVASLIATGEAHFEEIAQDGRSKGALSIKAALKRMYESRDKDGDFEIIVKERTPRRVHSAVMFSVWPYFRQMIDAGMREKNQRRLVLPCSGEDGGMSEEVLDLTIELAYMRRMTKKMSSRYLTADFALNVIFIADLYFGSDSTSSNAYSKLKKTCVDFLVADDESCIKLYRIASEAEMDDIATAAKQSLLTRVDELFASAATKAMIEDLPKKLIVDLFSSFAARAVIRMPAGLYSPTSPHWQPMSPTYSPEYDPRTPDSVPHAYHW